MSTLELPTADVREFTEKMGATIAQHPGQGWDASRELRWARAKLVMEEAAEFAEACGFDAGLALKHVVPPSAGRSFPDAIDALVDTIYVCIGSALAFGVDLSPIWEAVHRANMVKEGRGDGKAVKPPEWKPPDIQGELKKQGWEG